MSRSCLSMLLCALGLAPAASGQTVQMEFTPTGALKKLGFYETQTLSLVSERPASVKVLPAGAQTTQFGELRLGPAEKPALFPVAVAGAESESPRIYVDGNRDGDFTNDPPIEWNVLPYGVSDQRKLSRHLGSADVQLPVGPETKSARLHLFMFDPADPSRPNAKHQLHFYRDYGFEGKVTLEQRTYAAFLSDEKSTGDFRGTASTAGSGVILYLDLNGNGRFDRTTEAFDVRKPFSIGASTFEVKDLTSAGSFTIAPPAGKAAAAAPPPVAASDLQVGSSAIAFKAKDLDGKEIAFPGDYKGKVVLLDFWATWCGPCRKEIPHLVEAYTTHHGKGFEVLGISLDKPDGDKRLRDFIKDNAMPWAQVFDGKYWSADVAKLYDIHSIPAAFLVDGDTGTILAAKNALRGAGLGAEVAKAMKKKLGAK